jgi:hypothetical protein
MEPEHVRGAEEEWQVHLDVSELRLQDNMRSQF